MASGIYRIFNTVTNMCYVGSAKDFDIRWKRHFNDLRNGCHHNIKLQRSFNKHGENVFITEILELMPYEKDIIIEREDFWMKKLNSKESGYNIASASFGDTLSTHPNKSEIFSKISEKLRENNSKLTESERKDKFGSPNALDGKTLEDVYGTERGKEIRANMSKGQIIRGMSGSRNPFYGKDHSDEFKQKMSKLHKGKDPGNRKPVIIFGVEYSCCREAAEKFNTTAAKIRTKCNNANFSDFNFK